MPDEDPVMTLQFHPRLQDDGSLAPSLDEPPSPAPEAGEPAPVETQPTEQQVATPPPPTAENVEDGYYRISKNDPYTDIRRHADADPEFNRKVREWAGRANRRELNDEIARLRAENLEKERELRKRDIERMSPEEREEKFRSDPEFARAYTEVIHPSDDIPDPVLESEASYYEETRDDLLDEARSVQMSPQRIQQYQDAFQYCPVHRTDEHGFWDHDTSGAFFSDRFSDPALARKASFDLFQRMLNKEIRDIQLAASRPQQREPVTPAQAQVPDQAPPPPETPTASPPAETPVGAANAKLVASQPDTSLRNSVGGNHSARYTDEDLRSMGVDQRIALVESLGGRKKMIEDGVLYVPGLSEKVHGEATAPR